MRYWLRRMLSAIEGEMELGSGVEGFIKLSPKINGEK